MYKQVFVNLSNKLSPKFSTLGKYFQKERMIPPQNFTRYAVGGIVSVSCYLTLDDVTNVFPIDKEIKVHDPVQNKTIIINGFSSNTHRILNNISTAGAIGIIGWYAPYMTALLFTYHKYVEYTNKLIKYSNYLNQQEDNKLSKIEEK